MPKRRADSSGTRVTLGPDLRIAHAREIFEALEGAAARGPVEIDASEVAKVDAAGLQALAAALIRFREAGVQWRWNDPSLALISAAKMAGLESTLELP
jgi:anti-anti-sigma regulatory factor